VLRISKSTWFPRVLHLFTLFFISFEFLMPITLAARMDPGSFTSESMGYLHFIPHTARRAGEGEPHKSRATYGLIVLVQQNDYSFPIECGAFPFLILLSLMSVPVVSIYTNIPKHHEP
jgi:hypothetical protein